MLWCGGKHQNWDKGDFFEDQGGEWLYQCMATVLHSTTWNAVYLKGIPEITKAEY